MPPHLAHGVVSFEHHLGQKKYKELCEEAKKPEVLEKVVQWMVERDSLNSNRGLRPNVYGWLGDYCYCPPDREAEVKKAMKHPIVEHFSCGGDILVIVVSQVCFYVSAWYLGYALHCMGCPTMDAEPTCPTPEDEGEAR